MNETVLEGKDISFKYGDRHILHNCNFSVNKGDFSIIIGPNGSGKSTLLKICLGLLKPNNGIIRLYGKALKEFSEWRKIAYVPQRITAFNKGFPATVEEVVRAPIYSNSCFIKRKKTKINETINNALYSVGMEGYRTSLIGKLSVGQQQRVFIAKALISSPTMLFLDEPTAGIDNKTEKEFYDLLKKLNKDSAISIIMVTHDYADIKTMANKVYSLNDGSMEEQCMDLREGARRID